MENTPTPLMRQVAKIEGVGSKYILKGIREGKIVIPLNAKRKIKKVCAIGAGLKTKVNANIGTSTDKPSVKDELKKLYMAVEHGADTVMDLSVGGSLKEIRKNIIEHSAVPVGTVPVYEISVNALKKNGDFLSFGIEDILDTLEAQAEEGVDFFTIHAGVTAKSILALKRHKRILGIVSRGGAILANWMHRRKRENPFYAYFDRVLDIAYKYDVTLSLGDGLRPGSVMDATDQPQIAELRILGELARRARKRKVQVMIEGPGHVPINQIKKNVALEKKICNGAPFYVLGPLVTDVGSGYDHITCAIGGALAAGYGADFLCYVTPSEHLRHPTLADVRDGVIASRIAAHAGDIAKGIKGAIEWDRLMSEARRKRDWKKQIKLSIDPKRAADLRSSSVPMQSGVCTMCGRYCSIKLMDECMRA